MAEPRKRYIITTKPPRRPAPVKLHRVNGHDATMALLSASGDVRGGGWIQGAPSHIFTELLAALARRGYYLGVEERNG